MSVSENSPISVATIWVKDKVTDLNQLVGDANKDIILTSAEGINRDGEIVATGHRVKDDPVETRIYRLTPR